MSDSIIRAAVDGFVQKGFMFTAYDVTKFLRKAGEMVRHNEVNDIVKSMYANSEMGQYKREIKDIGTRVYPFVYTHTYSDVNDYDASWIDTNANQDGMRYDTSSNSSNSNSYVPLTTVGTPSVPVTPVAPVAPVTPKAPKVLLPIGVHKVTSEGRLNIPINAVGKIAAGAGYTCYIYEDSGKLFVASGQHGIFTCKYLGEVKVNVDGRIRLGKNYLKKIGQSDLFKVSNVGSWIEIESA